MQLRVVHLWNGSPAEPGEAVVVHLSHDVEGLRVEVDAPFHGDPPPPGPPGPTPRLWEHEVVEVFVGGPGEAYLEVELSPHGHHLVLLLSGVRQVEEDLLPLDFEVSRSGGRWIGRARIPAAWLPPGPLRVNACAVHGVGAERRHLSAVPLPGEKPDFHQPRAWIGLRAER